MGAMGAGPDFAPPGSAAVMSLSIRARSCAGSAWYQEPAQAGGRTSPPSGGAACATIAAKRAEAKKKRGLIRFDPLS